MSETSRSLTVRGLSWLNGGASIGPGAMITAEYDDIVGLIYDAAVEPLRLKNALARITGSVGAAGAHLVGFDKPNQQVVLSAITGFSPLGEIDYNERYAKGDPRAPVMLGAPVGQWLSCHHFLTQDFVDRSDFFQDFLIPYGSRFMSAVKLLESERYAAVLGIHRSITQAPLSVDELEFLRRLTPHLQRALGLIYEHARLQDQWSVAKATLDMLDYGAFVCDQSAQVLVVNEAAAAIFEQHDGLSLAGERVVIKDAPVQTRWRGMLLAPRTRDATSEGSSRGGALLVPRPSALQAYQLILRRIEPSRSVFGFANNCLWSVMISDPAHTSVPTMRAISVLYGLTPAETRLATFLVAGAAPEEIAAQAHVKIATIRSQLASLFAKTGTRRQAELVRLFSTVPALRAEQTTVNGSPASHASSNDH